jgi:indole-3-glycerol phosphate synthase
LVELTHELGMKCLLESHNRQDLEKALSTDARIIGINARNLETFEIDLQNIIDLAGEVPKDRILVAESGIESIEDVLKVRAAGASGVLVGMTLMQAENVAEKIKELKII